MDNKPDEENDMNIFLPKSPENDGPHCSRIIPECNSRQCTSADVSVKIYSFASTGSIFQRINKPLIPLKFALFSIFAGSFQLLPFIVVFLKQQGLSPFHISVIFGTTPVFQFVVQLLSGVISDKTGKHKMLLYVNILASIVFLSCMLLLPDNQSISILNKGHSNLNISKEIIQYFNGSNCTYFNSLNGTAVPCDFYGTVSEKYCNVSTLEIINLNNTFCAKIHNTSQLSNSNSKTDKIPVPLYFLVSVFVLMVGHTVCKTVIFRIFEVTIMNAVKTFNSDYGKQRLWSLLGMAILPPITGFIIQKVSTDGKEINFSVPVFIYDTCYLIAFACTWKLNIKTRQPAKNMWKTMKPFLMKIDVLAFFVVLAVSGSTWYFFVLYSPYCLSELGASSILLGLKEAVQSVVGMPIVFYAENIFNYIENRKVFLLALLGHVVLCTSYSYLVNPWWALLCGTCYIFTYHLMWVATVTYAHKISPQEVVGTMIVSAGFLHFSLGKAVGSYLGGFMMSKYGSRTAFRVMGAISGVTAILYAIFLIFQRKKYNKVVKTNNAVTNAT